MRGLKTQENAKFIKFHELIQNAADEKGMVWFAFAGEGRTIETEQMEAEDMSGWLIPKDRAGEFEKEWRKDSCMERWADYFLWVSWIIDDSGNIGVEFMD